MWGVRETLAAQHGWDEEHLRVGWSSRTKEIRGVDRAPSVRALVGQAKESKLFGKQRGTLGGFLNFNPESHTTHFLQFCVKSAEKNAKGRIKLNN